MKPGRELDALIAEKVMGEQVVINKSGYRGGYYYSIGPAEWYDNAGSIKLSNPLPPYSEDIAAAWRVVDKLTKDFTVRLEVSPILNQVIVEIDCPGKDWIAVDADTAPHAICLAALRLLDMSLMAKNKNKNFLDSEKIEYDGSSIRLIIENKHKFINRLKRIQKKLLKNLFNAK